MEMTRKRENVSGVPATSTSVLILTEDKATHLAAKELAADLGISMSELIWRAVDDYVTLHQIVVPGEARLLIRDEDYKKMLQQNGF